MDVRGALTQAYTAYVQSLYAAVPEPHRAAITQGFAQYMQAAQAAGQEPAGQVAAQAFADYARAVQGTLSEDPVRARADDALRAYVAALKEAIDGADPTALDHGTLALLAHQVGTVAWMAQRDGDVPPGP